MYNWYVWWAPKFPFFRSGSRTSAITTATSTSTSTRTIISYRSGTGPRKRGWRRNFPFQPLQKKWGEKVEKAEDPDLSLTDWLDFSFWIRMEKVRLRLIEKREKGLPCASAILFQIYEKMAISSWSRRFYLPARISFPCFLSAVMWHGKGETVPSRSWIQNYISCIRRHCLSPASIRFRTAASFPIAYSEFPLIRHKILINQAEV